MAVLAQKTFTIRKTINGQTLTFSLQPDKACTQIYVRDNKTFTPDYSNTNLTLTPLLLVSGKTGDQSANLTGFKWTVTKQDGTAATQTLTAGTGNAKKLASNLTDATGLTIKCEATYTDPVSQISTPVVASIEVVKQENAGANIMAVAYTPEGDTFVNDTKNLKIHCGLMRGGDIDATDVQYTWQMLVGGTWKTLNSTTNYGVGGYTTNEITVPASAITNVGIFKCSIKDTDKGSGTYNKTVSTVVTLYDGTDPYDIHVYLPQGDSISEGGSVPVYFMIDQGGQYITDRTWLTAHTVRFWRFDANNVLDTTFGTNGYKPAALNSTKNQYDATISYGDLLSATQGFCVDIN
jgi:hypothetical protein